MFRLMAAILLRVVILVVAVLEVPMNQELIWNSVLTATPRIRGIAFSILKNVILYYYNTV